MQYNFPVLEQRIYLTAVKFQLTALLQKSTERFDQ